MTINCHIGTFAGLPVVDFEPEGQLPDDPAGVAWRVAVDGDSGPAAFAALLTTLLERVPAEAVRALVIGDWGEAYEDCAPIDLLVSLAPRLTGLRALFLGEMTFEECEVSWIQVGDVTPLLTAYPRLEVLRVRGGAEALAFTSVPHDTLRELAFETGGLQAEIARSALDCEMPALTHLEFWLGVASYGGTVTLDDLAPLLAGERFPNLRYLGLRNAEHADDIASALATAPVVRRLETLDLSLGTLGDAGAQALLDGQPLTHLRMLDLHHHYMSDEMMDRLPAALPGVRVEVFGQEEEDEYGRYTAVGE